MARKQTLVQRIALEGGDEIRKELEALGEEGKKAFELLKREADALSNTGNGFTKFLQETRKEFQVIGQHARNFGKAVGDVGEAARKTAQRVTLITAAAAGLGAGMFAFSLSAAHAAEQQGELGQALGLGVEEFGRLAFAARQSGVQEDQFRLGMQRLADQIVETANATDKSATILGRLGIRATEADGSLRSTEAVLGDLSEKFVDIEDGARRTALAMELFGARAGPRLIPLLLEGQEGLTALGDEAERLGLVMTEEQFKIARVFGDTVDAFTDMVGAIKRDVGLLFAPIFTEATQTAINALAENREAIIQFATEARDNFVPLMRDIMALISGRDEDVQNKALLQFRDDLVAAVGLLANVGRAFVAAFGAVQAGLQIVLDLLNAVFGTDLQAGAVIMSALVLKLLGVFRLLATSVTAVRLGFVLLGAIFGSTVGAIAAIAAAILLAFVALQKWGPALAQWATDALGITEEVRAIFSGLRDFLLFLWEDPVAAAQLAWQTIVTAAQQAWDSIVAAVRSAIDSLPGIFSSALNAVANYFLDLGERIDDVMQGILAWVNRVISALKRLIGLQGDAASGGGGGEGFARGGSVRGPGTSTSDSILSWLSDGEWVMRAAAVRKYGLGLMQSINSLRFNPEGFAAGGLVSVPATVIPSQIISPPSPTGRTPLNLSIAGEVFPDLLAPDDVADKLVQFVARRQVRSAGRKPSWSGGR